MIQNNQRIFNLLNMFTDGLIVVVSLYIGFAFRFNFMEGFVMKSLNSYLLLALLAVPLQLILYKAVGVYDPGRRRRAYQIIARIIAVNIAAFAVLNTVLYFAKEMNFSRIAISVFLMVEMFLHSFKHGLVRFILRKRRSRGLNLRRVLIIGNNDLAERCAAELSETPEFGCRIVGYLGDEDSMPRYKRLGNLENIKSVIRAEEPDEVIAALEDQNAYLIPQIIQECNDAGIRFSFIPAYARYLSSHPQVDSINGIPLLNIRRIPLDGWINAFIKRSVDIIGALILILLSSPVMLVCAVGVRLSSPGPILFKQARVGYNGRIFHMYKFRSMRVNDRSDTAWSTKKDDRRTPFGSFIRKYSLDELPQFFNVLFGDMSLVGPRPEIPHFVEQFREEYPLYMVKHQVRPGITGWAQVNGLRGDTSIEKRVRYDIHYVENWTLLFDIQILFMTLRCFVNDES
ncbi:MAG: undecaprenyl-phosphate glucose phosphotransferase [Ruminococcaceae bacterium]|nr:undecaprenyl-phosphate glucose phosphotransferase [Oscillospiraceae bacterium]